MCVYIDMGQSPWYNANEKCNIQNNVYCMHKISLKRYKRETGCFCLGEKGYYDCRWFFSINLSVLFELFIL